MHSVDNVFVAGDVAGFHDAMILDPRLPEIRVALPELQPPRRLVRSIETDADARKSEIWPISRDGDSYDDSQVFVPMARLLRQRRRAADLRVPLRGGDACGVIGSATSSVFEMEFGADEPKESTDTTEGQPG